MATLKETKVRINSVKGTLKITSAMKLVASAKLISAEKAVRALLPYRDTLSSMLRDLQTTTLSSRPSEASGEISRLRTSSSARDDSKASSAGVAIIAVASNSSLCGGFNANAVRAVLECAKAQPGEVTVYSIGKKMADVMRRCGYPSPKELNAISSKPDYKVAASLAEELMAAYAAGRFSEVYLIYNHFVTTSRQEVLTETFLGPTLSSRPSPTLSSRPSEASGEISRLRTSSSARDDSKASFARDDREYIIEPSPQEAAERLFPLTLKVRLFAALLDSSAAEHAARLVAMQTATDNGEELLHEITLEYNKARQQKITSEILDLASSSV